MSWDQGSAGALLGSAASSHAGKQSLDSDLHSRSRDAGRRVSSRASSKKVSSTSRDHLGGRASLAAMQITSAPGATRSPVTADEWNCPPAHVVDYSQIMPNAGLDCPARRVLRWCSNRNLFAGQSSYRNRSLTSCQTRRHLANLLQLVDQAVAAEKLTAVGRQEYPGLADRAALCGVCRRKSPRTSRRASGRRSTTCSGR